MKRVIVIALPAVYLPVFEKLKGLQRVMPVAWICQKKDASKVQSIFTDVDVLDPVSNFVYGELFEGGAHSYKNIDKKLLLSMLPCQQVLIEMMVTRSDQGGGFGYYEALGVYYNYLANAIYLLEKYSADLVFFQEIPHNMWDYVLYGVAKHKGIECIMLLDTPYEGYLIAYNDLDRNHLFSGRDVGDKQNEECLAESAVERRRNYISRLRGGFKNGATYQFKQAHGNYIGSLALLDVERRLKKKERKESCIFIKEKLKSLVGKRGLAGVNYLKCSGFSWGVSCMSRLDFYRERVRHIKYRLVLLNKYKDICVEPDLNSKFVYFPLHKQPELSTVPMAGVFSDQLLALRMLHSALPKDYKIIIKENPYQFEWHRGGFSRHLTYYEEMNAMERVEFVDVGFDSYKLIDACLFVYTVVGTAGWEAIVRGKSAVITGNCVWYYNNEQAYKVSSVDDIKKSLVKIEDSVPQSTAEIESFLVDFEYSAFPAVTSQLHQDKLGVDKSENQCRLVSVVLGCLGV